MISRYWYYFVLILYFFLFLWLAADFERKAAQAPSSLIESPSTSFTITNDPTIAENGDIRGIDNDGDGRAEPVHVHGYYRKDGTYVRGHYRAKPRR
ncbi:hypothetical protein KKG19_06135 [Patescibacteria group bacterium]|nr:hypothetical protein [Patescibacteria group bacterium]